MRLLVTKPMTDAARAAIAARFEVTFGTAPLDAAAAAAALRHYDAILPTLGDDFSAAAFAGGPLRCKVLANFGAGYNHIDVAAARAAGVIVTNTPDVVTDATADIALTLMLMVARRAGEGERVVRAGGWTSGWQPTQFLGTHVSGKTVGIVGMGRIGQAVARRCHFGFGMPVVYHNRSARAVDFPARQVADLPMLMGSADFVVVAVPGGAATRHLIGAAELAAMRPGAFLVNVARGDVVEEAALIAALQAGTLAGAGLDVYEHEPIVPDALRAMQNTVLLPHIGTAATETRTAMALRALENLLAVAEGREPGDRVA